MAQDIRDRAADARQARQTHTLQPTRTTSTIHINDDDDIIERNLGITKLEKTKTLIHTFSGKEDDWPEFQFKFLAQMNQLHLKQHITDANMSINDKYVTAQQTIFNHLVAGCKGDALRRIRLIVPDDPRCALKAWQTLVKKYAPHTNTRISIIMEKLLYKTYEKDKGDVEKYFDEVLELKLQLEDVGGTMPENAVLVSIARGLPAEYDNVLDNI